jgi:hypothetical protein
MQDLGSLAPAAVKQVVYGVEHSSEFQIFLDFLVAVRFHKLLHIHPAPLLLVDFFLLHRDVDVELQLVVLVRLLVQVARALDLVKLRLKLILPLRQICIGVFECVVSVEDFAYLGELIPLFLTDELKVVVVFFDALHVAIQFCVTLL